VALEIKQLLPGRGIGIDTNQDASPMHAVGSRQPVNGQVQQLPAEQLHVSAHDLGLMWASDELDETGIAELSPRPRWYVQGVVRDDPSGPSRAVEQRLSVVGQVEQECLVVLVRGHMVSFLKVLVDGPAPNIATKVRLPSGVLG